MTIHLPSDIESLIGDAARRLGTTPELLAIEGLRKMFAEPEAMSNPATANNLLEFLGDDVGAVNGVGEALSENCGSRFTECLIDKQQASRL